MSFIPSYVCPVFGVHCSFGNGVGKEWTRFTNGEAARDGFYDEMRPRVVKDGSHGQLIEINSLGVVPTAADRYAGIYQGAKGLNPGATYEFSLWGEMQEEAAHPDEDAYRWRIRFRSTQDNVCAYPNWPTTGRV
jgi:hypothetical protein